MKDNILKKLAKFELIVKKPALFISEYFYEIRNEIDLKAETLLESSSLALKQEKINATREAMISELNRMEKEFLDYVRATNFENESILKKIEQYRTKLSELVNSEKENRKKCAQLLSLEIENDLKAFERSVLNNKSVFFKANFTNKLGILVAFENDFLNESQMKFLK